MNHIKHYKANLEYQVEAQRFTQT